MQVRKQQAELDMEQQTGSKFGKGVSQGSILSPYLFNLYTEYIMRNAGLEKHKLESRLPGEIPTTSDMQMVNTKIRSIIFFAAKDGEAL